MARNLRKKISESDSLYIQDVNPAVCEQFKKEVGNVEIVESVRQVAENAVCIHQPDTRAHTSFHCSDEAILFYL